MIGDHPKEEIIKYRISKAKELLEEVSFLLEHSCSAII